ncbi:hypothetical protein HanRHA438_Chr08g0327391 [Helianthus annuus]|nr:hypothetical protein HanRHA438_Chr08g0327391 [Helianthus annuus]
MSRHCSRALIILLGCLFFFFFILGDVHKATTVSNIHPKKLVPSLGMNKRRVPNGPDPIHNRRSGNSRRPPGQA